MAWDGPKGVVTLARFSGMSRSLGLLLDVMNFEAKRPLIKPGIIKKIRKEVAGKSYQMFPRDEILVSRFAELRNKLVHQSLLTKKEMMEIKRAVERFQGYSKLGEKWGVNVILPREVIRKVLEDLAIGLKKD